MLASNFFINKYKSSSVMNMKETLTDEEHLEKKVSLLAKSFTVEFEL